MDSDQVQELRGLLAQLRPEALAAEVERAERVARLEAARGVRAELEDAAKCAASLEALRVHGPTPEQAAEQVVSEPGAMHGRAGQRLALAKLMHARLGLEATTAVGRWLVWDVLVEVGRRLVATNFTWGWLGWAWAGKGTARVAEPHGTRVVRISGAHTCTVALAEELHRWRPVVGALPLLVPTLPLLNSGVASAAIATPDACASASAAVYWLVNVIPGGVADIFVGALAAERVQDGEMGYWDPRAVAWASDGFRYAGGGPIDSRGPRFCEHGGWSTETVLALGSRSSGGGGGGGSGGGDEGERLALKLECAQLSLRVLRTGATDTIPLPGQLCGAAEWRPLADLMWAPVAVQLGPLPVSERW